MRHHTNITRTLNETSHKYHTNTMHSAGVDLQSFLSDIPYIGESVMEKINPDAGSV